MARLTVNDLKLLEPQELEEFLKDSSPEEVDLLFRDWSFLARHEQLLPGEEWMRAQFDKKHRIRLVPGEGDWQTWAFIAGRGSGKTRGGGESIREWVRQGYGRLGLIGPTASDVRDIMIEGESGILEVSWKNDCTYDGRPIGRPRYEPSKRRLTWENGAMATAYSAEEPERLRGPQHEKIWADELAAWKRLRETWDMAMFGLRLGLNPQAIITTTPKPLAVLLEILRDPKTAITVGTTYDNRANLAPQFFARVVKRYEGTRLGRQELQGEILLEAEGALWNRDMIDLTRADERPGFVRVVVGVDPAVSSNKESNETGIVAVGKGRNDHGYVLADSSGKYKPAEWAQKAIDAYEQLGADCIVAEGNQGGDLVKHTIHTINPNIPVRMVRATRGKAARAEPVSALYEQGRGHHVGTFPLLEDQLVTWEPESGDESPDRLDAMVWAFTNLFFKGGGPRRVGSAPVVITG